MAQEDDNSKKPAPRTDFRVLLMWGAIIAVLAGLLIYTPGGKVPSREITMAQVLEFAKQKNISELTLKNNPVGGAKNYYTITGELRSSPTNGTEPPPNNAQAPAVPNPSLGKFSASGTLLEEDIKLLRDTVPAQAFKDVPAGSRMGELIWAVLPSLIIGGIILFLIFRSIKRAQSQQFSFGRSRARLLDKEKSKVSFKDVAGCDEAKEEVSEVVDFRFLGADGDECRFVQEVRQIRSRETGGCFGNVGQVDFFGNFKFFCVNLKNGFSAFEVGQINVNLSVKASRTE